MSADISVPKRIEYTKEMEPAAIAQHLRAQANSADRKREELLAMVRAVEDQIRTLEVSKSLLLDRIGELNIFANKARREADEREPKC